VKGWLQQVVVQRRHPDPTLDKLLHDRAHLVHGQHQIAHHHAAIAHFLERQIAAERKAGLQLDAVERDLEIGARQPDAVDAAGHCRAGLAERLPDLGLPVAIGGVGGGRQRRGKYQRSAIRC